MATGSGKSMCMFMVPLVQSDTARESIVLVCAMSCNAFPTATINKLVCASCSDDASCKEVRTYGLENLTVIHCLSFFIVFCLLCTHAY